MGPVSAHTLLARIRKCRFLSISLFLQNSPLFQYLQDLGHTDFESCQTASREEEEKEEYGGAEGDLSSPGQDQQKTSVSSPSSRLQT